MSKENTYYIPAEDEPSVFSSDVHVNEHGSCSYTHDRWAWPLWFNAKQKAAYYADWKAKNPDAPIYHCPPPWFALQCPVTEGIALIKRLREELKPNWMQGPPVFDPVPTMFIGDTRQISLRWVLQYARDNNMSPESAVLVAEHERDLGGLALNDQDVWQGHWWKYIMGLPGIAYPIWRYKDGYENVAVPYLLMPGAVSESIVIVRVHEKNPNITYKLVTIRQKGGEVVGEFTGYEGFDREQLDVLLKSFRAGF
jgi:hypothetical protein